LPLGWEPKVKFKALIEMMVDADSSASHVAKRCP
jgi:GDP-D-mannose dehydratase